MHRNVIAALGVLATLTAACSSSSPQPTRPVAAPGQVVTVFSEHDGGLRDPGSPGEYDTAAMAPGGGDLYIGMNSYGRVVKVPRRGQARTLLDCHTVFPEGMAQAKLRSGSRCDESASAFAPTGMAVSNDGTLYVADEDNAVWAVTPSGRIRKVVGSGRGLPIVGPVLSGPASRVDVSHPGAVALGPDGSVYFEDIGRVVKLGRDGMVSIVAGNAGPSGDSGDGGLATQAAIEIGGLAVDSSGNLYIGGGSRIRRVDNQGIITTVAGPPATAAQFSSISALAFDGAGNLFVAEDTPRRVRRIGRDGSVTTVAADLPSVYGIAVDNAGNLYIPESVAGRAQMVGAAR